MTTLAALRTRLPALRQRTRLATGLILFTYVSFHLLDHASGIVSVKAMEDGANLVIAVLHLKPVTALLYGALLVHFLLALWAIYSRRRLLGIPPAEAAQLVLGLAIIPLLAVHAVSTRLAGELYKVYYSHTFVLVNIGLLDPVAGFRQGIALVVAWGHGCIGLFFWLRLKPWFPKAQFILFALALLIPVLALCGYYAGYREIAALAAADPNWTRRTLADLSAPDPAARAHLARIVDFILAFWAGGVALALAARFARTIVERHRGLVRITYPGGKVIEIPPGTSVLEASVLNAIPHAHVCGGRGRCSTCRIRVSRGLEHQPPASPDEAAVLARIGAAPNMRLACQLRPAADLAVAPLLPPTATAGAARARGGAGQGQEQEIAILFADLRDFTRLSERKLPYDVVFVLNRYFEAMGRAVEDSGGHVDKFIGDGVMALFGIGRDAGVGARQAFAAARAMGRMLGDLNATLTHDLDEPLRIGIGIHVGPAIVGEMGYGRATSLTAIGDTVNTASRIESLSKEYRAELVVSAIAAERAGIDLGAFALETADVRGREETLAVRVIPRAADLPG